MAVTTNGNKRALIWVAFLVPLALGGATWLYATGGHVAQVESKLDAACVKLLEIQASGTAKALSNEKAIIASGRDTQYMGKQLDAMQQNMASIQKQVTDQALMTREILTKVRALKER